MVVMNISKEIIEMFNLSDRNIKDINKKLEYIKENNYQTTLNFIIHGDPVHANRPRTGRGGHVYVPGAKDNKSKLRPIIIEQLPEGFEPVDTACVITVKAYRKTLSTFSTTDKALAELGVIRPITTPDIDNRVKPYMDIMNGIVYKDDGQVIDGYIHEYYSINPRVEIEVKYDSILLSAKFKK